VKNHRKETIIVCNSDGSLVFDETNDSIKVSGVCIEMKRSLTAIVGERDGRSVANSEKIDDLCVSKEGGVMNRMIALSIRKTLVGLLRKRRNEFKELIKAFILTDTNSDMNGFETRSGACGVDKRLPIRYRGSKETRIRTTHCNEMENVISLAIKTMNEILRCVLSEKSESFGFSLKCGGMKRISSSQKGHLSEIGFSNTEFETRCDVFIRKE